MAGVSPRPPGARPAGLGPSSSAPVVYAELAVLVISRRPPCWPRQLTPQCRPAVCGGRSPVNQKEVLYGARGNKKRNLQSVVLSTLSPGTQGRIGFGRVFRRLTAGYSALLKVYLPQGLPRDFSQEFPHQSCNCELDAHSRRPRAPSRQFLGRGAAASDVSADAMEQTATQKPRWRR